MKNLKDILNESLVNEGIDTWKIWGVINPRSIKQFQRELEKFDVTSDNSDYNKDDYNDPFDEIHGYLIDVDLEGKFNKVEKFADKYFLKFDGPGSLGLYDKFIKRVKK